MAASRRHRNFICCCCCICAFYASSGIAPTPYIAAEKPREPLFLKETHKSKRIMNEADPAISTFLCQVRNQ